MSGDERLAIVISPKASNLRAGQGELDADAIKERLQLDDTAFAVVALDPSTDVAEQIDALFDARSAGDGGAAEGDEGPERSGLECKSELRHRQVEQRWIQGFESVSRYGG